MSVVGVFDPLSPGTPPQAPRALKGGPATPSGLGGGDPFTPPPPYPVNPRGQPGLDSLCAQLEVLCKNLDDNCGILEGLLLSGINSHQAELFANTLGEGLQSVERQELTLLGATPELQYDPLSSSAPLKARARRLLVQCYKHVVPHKGSVPESDRKVLPKIQLPKFQGEFAKWTNFGGLFQALVDSRTDLSAVVKFNYLLQSLLDEPLEIVKGLTVTETNYQIALSLLQERYGNRDKIQ